MEHTLKYFQPLSLNKIKTILTNKVVTRLYPCHTLVDIDNKFEQALTPTLSFVLMVAHKQLVHL